MFQQMSGHIIHLFYVSADVRAMYAIGYPNFMKFSMWVLSAIVKCKLRTVRGNGVP